MASHSNAGTAGSQPYGGHRATILGDPPFANPAVPTGTFYGIPPTDHGGHADDVRLAVHRGAYLSSERVSSDRVAGKATMRVGFALHARRLGR